MSNVGPSQILRVEYDHHAAHDPYTGRPLYDLQWFHVRAPLRRGGPERPADLPEDAEYHSGLRDKHGAQVWLFVCRVAPTTQTCPRCESRMRGAA
jgi:hypothetical protein